MKKSEKFLFALTLSLAVLTVNAQQSVKFLGTMEFSDAGVLFVGDNLSGAIHAIDLSTESRSKEAFEVNINHIDTQVAAVLGTSPGNIQINDLVRSIQRHILNSCSVKNKNFCVCKSS